MTARFAQGKYALSISDRSGLAFPYLEMVRNGQDPGFIFQNMNLNHLSYKLK